MALHLAAKILNSVAECAERAQIEQTYQLSFWYVNLRMGEGLVKNR
jgi:hypothetical protein